MLGIIFVGLLLYLAFGIAMFSVLALWVEWIGYNIRYGELFCVCLLKWPAILIKKSNRINYIVY